MKIKEEYLDGSILNPYTNKTEYIRLIQEEMYPYLFKIGFEYLFEIEIETEVEKIEVDDKVRTNGINTSDSDIV